MNPAVATAAPGPLDGGVASWRDALVAGVREGERLVSLFGRPAEGGSAALTAVTEAGGALRLRRVHLALEPGLHSLVEDLPQAHVFERELHEQLGLRVRGHPWLKPVRFPPGTSTDDHVFLEMAGPQHHEVQVGPIHAGVIEPGAFRFLCLGERVHHLEIHLGYQHRGVEARLLATEPFAAGPLVEVAAGDTSVAHAWAWAAALEALVGLEVAPAVVAAREVMLELERAAMHLAGLAGLALDLGALQGASTWQRLRTAVINTSMRLCGSRFGRTAVRPGGTGAGWSEALATQLQGELSRVEADHEQIAAHFLGDAVTRHRFAGCGVVSAADAVGLGLVGPSARASGVAVDLRARPGFTPVVEAGGDVLARAALRARELPESLRRVRALLADHPAVARCRAPARPLPADQLAVAAVEGWRGEVVHALETGPGGALVHHHVQDPSLRDWFGLAVALRGEDISDFPINNKSFDLSYCGNDL